MEDSNHGASQAVIVVDAPKELFNLSVYVEIWVLKIVFVAIIISDFIPISTVSWNTSIWLTRVSVTANGREATLSVPLILASVWV